MTDAESSAEDKERIIFVKTLAKYKYLLSPGVTSELIKRKNKGLIDLTDEFNKISKQNLSRVQIHRRIGNMKAKLKEKNYRISVQNEKLVYKEWEKMFLDLWVGDDTPVLPRKLYRAAEENEPKDKDIEIKVETEEYVLPDSSHTSTEVSNHIREIDSERGKFDEEKYEKMSMEDLKRASLIARIRSFKAQERAALSEEKLKTYQLFLLTLKD